MTLQGKKLKNRLMAGFGLVLLLFCFWNFDWQLFGSAVAHIRGWLLLGAFLTFFGTWFSMTLQWRLLLPPAKPISLARLFQVTAAFAMLANSLPFYSGHALMIYLVGHREKVGKTATLSLLTVEQIADGFGKILWFALIAFICPFPEWMKRGMEGIVLWVLVITLILVIMACRFRNRREVLNRDGWKRIFSFVADWAHHLHVIRDMRKMIGVVALAFIMKGLEVLAIFLVQKSFGVELPVYSPLLVFAALSLTTVIPLVPGRLGVFEAAAFVVYQFFGVDATRAVMLGLLIHVVHTLPFLVTGYFCMLRSHTKIT